MTFQPASNVFNVNTLSSSSLVGDVDVAAAANGDFVVTWSRAYNGNSNDNDIFFRRFNADGTPKDASEQVVINSSANEYQSAVSMAADGSFVVTWINVRNSDLTGDLYLQRFDASGNKLGTAVNDTSNLSPTFSNPDVAVFDSGDFILAASRTTDSTRGIYGILWSTHYRDGRSASESLIRRSQLPGNLKIDVRPGTVQLTAITEEPKIALSWTESVSNSQEVLFQAFDDSMTPIFSPRIANVDQRGTQFSQSIAIDSIGRMNLAWTDLYSLSSQPNNFDVRYRQFSPDGRPDLVVDQNVNVDAGIQLYPDIAAADDGRFAVVYDDLQTKTTTLAQYDADGFSRGSTTVFSGFSGSLFPRLAVNGEGTRLVVVGQTEDDTGVIARVFATPAPAIQFAQASYQANEGVGTTNFVTLTRTGETFASSQVQVNITGGTATAGSDYSNTDFPRTINFAAGETSKTVAIPIAQDTLVEGTETITFSIAGLSNAAIGATSTATLQILDDDTSTGGTGGTGGTQKNPFIGDATDNTINGDDLNNSIDGKEGNDSLFGNGGDDILVGGFGNDVLFGGLGNDALQGGDGNDALLGMYGSDALTGGSGSDSFAFNIANTVFNRSFVGMTNITDFTRGADKILLGKQTFPKLRRGLKFASVKSVAQAKKSDAFITYVRSSGTLFYNENGRGSNFGTGGKFASLTAGSPLTASDFTIVN